MNERWARMLIYPSCLLLHSHSLTHPPIYPSIHPRPLTSFIVQILPFIMFGIGVDAAFIISGEYARTDKTKTPEERVHDTIDEVGLSITLTTLTSVVAFGLGSLSSIPAVKWLCYYAFPTILIDGVYQFTFFVALVVIDERRVADKRRDCLVCCTVQGRVDNDGDEEDDDEPKESLFDRMMGSFAEFLFKPWVKLLVVLSFMGLLSGCAYSASQLTQEFDFTDVLPADSYATEFFDNFDAYTTQSGVRPIVYFRNVDQSDPTVQAQMEKYVADLQGLQQITDAPVFFWLKDFKEFVNETSSIQSLPFNEQIRAFLADSVYEELYSDNIVLDSDGNIAASRTEMLMDEVDLEDIGAQIDALSDQEAVTDRQLINEGKGDDLPFFNFDPK